MEELYYLNPEGLLYLWHRLRDIFATSENIPTSLSQLTNDTDFQSADEVMTAIASAIGALNIPVNVSDLINDSGYQTAAEVTSAVNSAIAAADIPTKTSDLTNDSNFQTGTDVDGKISTAISGIAIPKSLSDLTNDMTFQTLSQITTLINNAIGEAVGLKFEVVSTLPATGEGGTIYLVPNGAVLVPNIYDEYIYYNGSWEKIGSTDIDLTGYLKVTDVDSALSSTSENPVQNKVVKAALDEKVDKETGKGLSTNDYTDTDKAIVDGVTSALAGKADTSDVPTALSDLTDDATHRLVTDSEKSTWSGKADASDIPTKTSDLTNDSNYISDANYVHTDNNYTTTEKTKLAGLSNYDDTALSGRVSTLEGEIPSGASSSNKLVTASDLAGKQDAIQFDTMPTAAAGNVGTIIQYTGTTTASYTTGYFYKCVEGSGSYSWVQTDVQPSSGGGGASESEIAPVEATSTASKAYAINDLLIYNGHLYRVTAAISSGVTITPNTNCVETSVSEVFVRKTGDTMSGGLTTPNLTVGTRTGTIGENSFAQGDSVEASTYFAHAEGEYSKATGSCSHAEGVSTKAMSTGAHAEGQNTQAIASGSHAEGSSTKAQGLRSHAEGYFTTAGYENQHVQGKYNNNKSTSAFEIGNGTSSARSNALEVTWDGDVKASGDIEDGSGNTLSGTNSNLATVENSTTASQAYAIGDYLVYGGQLYKVTAAIAQGGTITISGANANVAVTTVIEAINDMVGLALVASY